MGKGVNGSLFLFKTPGPGSYDGQAYEKTKDKDPIWSLSKTSRDYLFKTNELGPGQYDADLDFKSVIKSSPKYHFGSERKLQNGKNNVPGPGSYQHDLVRSRMSIKIG